MENLDKVPQMGHLLGMNKETVKEWLKEFDHSRAWLARELEVAPKTVNNWLGSPRPIPDKAIIIIERLIEADRLRESHSHKVSHTLTLEFSSHDFDQIEEAAHRADKKIRTWATDTLRTMANRKPEDIFKELQAAEAEQAPYNAEKPNSDIPSAS